MSTTVTLIPTANLWDAPVVVVVQHDGSTRLQRHRQDGYEGAVFVHEIPHGVVLVDGQMSEFDQARQPPAVPPRALIDLVDRGDFGGGLLTGGPRASARSDETHPGSP